MTVTRRDDVNQKYVISKNIEKITSAVFYINFATAIVSLFIPNSLQEMVIMLQVIMAISSVTLSGIDDGVFWYAAERARRRNNIQTAFDITLDEAQTVGYYNNTLEPSIEKYALNAFESLHHSRGIAEKMICKSILKSAIALLILFVACRYIADGNVVLAITQTAFSSCIVEETIMLLIYRNRLDTLYNEFYTQFITLGVGVDKQKPILLAATVEYEAIKAHYKVRLDSSIHKKCNPELSAEWNKISQEIATTAIRRR